MGLRKDFDRRIRQGGDDAIAAVAELWEARERILFDITDAFTKARWIPVGERLPPGGVRVLIWCGPGTFVDFATLDWKYGWHYDDYGSPEPTHWMPIPAPPADAK